MHGIGLIVTGLARISISVDFVLPTVPGYGGPGGVALLPGVTGEDAPPHGHAVAEGPGAEDEGH